MGGKSDGGNEEIVALEKEQADEARAKETERQAKIDAGLKAVEEAFTGTPEYDTRTKAGFRVPPHNTNVPWAREGYTWTQAPGTTTTTAGTSGKKGTTQYSDNAWGSDTRGGGNAFYNSPAQSTGTAGTAGATTTSDGRWYLTGPNGEIYEQGSIVPAESEQVFTGRYVGGIDDAFFKEYQTGVEDYLLPQVADQYKDAQEKETYDFARAGTSKSSAAVQEAADLAQQNVENEADVRKTADVATGDLRDRVEAEKAKAIAQVYATEDPTIAENQALTAVKNITNDTPDISALGKVFETALIGGANALTGYKNQQSVNATNQAIKDAAKVYQG